MPAAALRADVPLLAIFGALVADVFPAGVTRGAFPAFVARLPVATWLAGFRRAVRVAAGLFAAFAAMPVDPAAREPVVADFDAVAFAAVVAAPAVAVAAFAAVLVAVLVAVLLAVWAADLVALPAALVAAAAFAGVDFVAVLAAVDFPAVLAAVDFPAVFAAAGLAPLVAAVAFVAVLAPTDVACFPAPADFTADFLAVDLVALVRGVDLAVLFVAAFAGADLVVAFPGAGLATVVPAFVVATCAEPANRAAFSPLIAASLAMVNAVDALAFAALPVLVAAAFLPASDRVACTALAAAARSVAFRLRARTLLEPLTAVLLAGARLAVVFDAGPVAPVLRPVDDFAAVPRALVADPAAFPVRALAAAALVAAAFAGPDFAPVDFAAVDFVAVDFTAATLVADDLGVALVPVDFVAVDFAGADFAAVDFAAVAFAAVDFVAVDFAAVALVADDFAAVDFVAVDFAAVTLVADGLGAVLSVPVDFVAVDLAGDGLVAVDLAAGGRTVAFAAVDRAGCDLAGGLAVDFAALDFVAVDFVAVAFGPAALVAVGCFVVALADFFAPPLLDVRAVVFDALPRVVAIPSPSTIFSARFWAATRTAAAIPAFAAALGSPGIGSAAAFSAWMDLPSMRWVAAVAPSGARRRPVVPVSSARAVVMFGTLLVAAATRRGVAGRRAAVAPLAPAVAALPGRDAAPPAPVPVAVAVRALDFARDAVVPPTAVTRPEPAVARVGVPDGFDGFWARLSAVFSAAAIDVPPCE